MDACALLALIPDDERGGGVRTRKRSSTSQATGSAQSEGMSAEDILALILSASLPRRVQTKNGVGHSTERLERHSSSLRMCSGSTSLAGQPGMTP